MDLNELIGKPCTELTDDELEFSIQKLSKLKLSREIVSNVGVKKVKSNRDKKNDNLLSNLTPAQIAKLKLLLGV